MILGVVIVIFVIAFVIYRFLSDLNQDKSDLQGLTVAEKFNGIVDYINESAFGGMGQITMIDNRSFSLYQNGKYQIIYFLYSTGHLTITWKYTCYQKEVVHERIFRNVRNLSIFEQQKIAKEMSDEMVIVMQNHYDNVLRGV